MIVLRQIKQNISRENVDLKKLAASVLGEKKEIIEDIKILRESIDARKKPDIFRVLEIGVTLKGVNGIEAEKKYFYKKRKIDGEVCELRPYVFPYKAKGNLDTVTRPVIIGFGPAGLFCALSLARAGYKPVVFERGKAIEDRQLDVLEFWNGGCLKPESNVLFGEGGAGTFSDGKLNTLVKGSKELQRHVMTVFTEFGADEDICYSAKPHIGTDMLAKIIPAMRREIIRLGGEVNFGHKLTELIVEKEHITGVRISDGERIKAYKTSCVCLAIGHSARDTFRELYREGIKMEPKPFAVGVRCEHDQEMIDASQYGEGSGLTASYKLTAKSGERGVYSFCMCPGGYVVNSSSEEGRLCVNGMSYHDRDSKKANAAIVVAVGPEDYRDKDALAGIRWQEKLEEAAFRHRNGLIPVQTLKDFKQGISSTGDLFDTRIKGRYTGGNLKEFLPDFISEAIEEGFEQFGRKIKGFDGPQTLLIGLESRTSSPVRICRNEELFSIGGLFPCGEGAGYAGGITSAAVDGIKVAEAIAKKIREDFDK